MYSAAREKVRGARGALAVNNAETPGQKQKVEGNNQQTAADASGESALMLHERKISEAF